MDSKHFIEDFNRAKEKYPDLVYHSMTYLNYPYRVSGDFEIVDSENYHWGTFKGSIYFHSSYPKGFALLQDKSKIFPWNLDWHIDEKLGLCCVCGPLENIEKSSKGISVLSFIENYVFRFYANQIYRREFGHYKNGDYSHFEEGVWEDLEEEFDTSDRSRILTNLKLMGTNRGRNELCFCGSDIKFKKCHLHRIKYLQDLVGRSGIVN